MKPIQFFFTAFLWLLIMPLFNSSAQEIGKYVEQYEGRVGDTTIKIKLLRVGQKSDEEVLIQVLGVDDPVDSMIYKYKKQWKDREKKINEYKYVTTQIPGKEKFSLFHSDSYSGRQVFKIFLTAKPKDAIDIYPASRPEDLSPDTMYRQYLEQQKKKLKGGLGLLAI